MRTKPIKNQLDIFHEDYIPPVRTTYYDLGINEKINVKANSQGFAINYLRRCVVYWRSSSTNIMRTDHPEKLTPTWDWFYLHNHHNSIETLSWINLTNPTKPTKQRKLQLM